MTVIFKAIAWATAIMTAALAGQATGIDAEPLVLILSGAAAIAMSRSGRCGGLA